MTKVYIDLLDLHAIDAKSQRSKVFTHLLYTKSNFFREYQNVI